MTQLKTQSMLNLPKTNIVHVTLFAAACTLVLAAVVTSDPQRGGLIALEDGPLETLQALFYAAGAGICAWSWIKGRNRLAAAVWTALCILFVGEETSWFQRVFDYSVPAVEQVNGQGEFNLHNLSLFDTGRLLDENRSFKLSFEAMLNSQNLFRLAFFIYFLILPAAYFIKPLRKRLTRFGYVFGPSVSYLVVAWGLIAMTLVFTAMNGEPIKFYISEVRESIYAATIFLYAMTLYAMGQKRAAIKEY